MGSKVDLEKFTGQNDFNMWKIKMEALLITQGLGEAMIQSLRLKEVCDELETIEEGLNDESKALLLISSLPNSYERFVNALLYGSQKPQGQWVLDSGCTFHMCPNISYFTTYQPCDGGMVLIGLKVKTLRTDNGLEYCNKLFEEFCEKNSIQRHKTVTYTPQQNGLAERINRTLVEKVRCMLIYSKLPKTLWAKALNTTCYLVNRNPSTAIDCKTPMELWSERMAEYAKLRIFCCTTYAHVKQGKLEPRALKCRFLGYPEGVKGYRLWCVDSKPPQCIISRDVRFHEEELLNKQMSPVNNTESEPQAGVKHESAESEEDTYQLARDRKRRTIRPPKIYVVADLIAYALNAAQEPWTYQEAITGKNKLEWKRAIDEKMASLIKNKTWKLIEKPAKRKTVSCKWIFKIKDGIPGAEPRRFKARLVARGFTQKEGIDFTEVFSPVVRHASIRIILALVAVQNMYLEQMDVKTAFLHGELQEEIVMQQPKWFMTNPGYEHWRAVQWIMRYLKRTLEVGLVYGGEDKSGHTLIGYEDADFAGDLDKRRS
ncbi:Integrase catalytic domain-containing protein [Citrus sinensis]|nr:Integrase catalytic domain-containing protein [Citrus sinensis]